MTGGGFEEAQGEVAEAGFDNFELAEVSCTAGSWGGWKRDHRAPTRQHLSAEVVTTSASLTDCFATAADAPPSLDVPSPICARWVPMTQLALVGQMHLC